MNYSTPDTRHTEWGHSGITFFDRKDIVACLDFPTGPQGPVDGGFGSKERKHWDAVCDAWIEYAMLPDGAYFPRGLNRGTYSLTFNLEVR
jgi:hypothetical protein